MKKWIFRVLGALLILTFFYFLMACGKKKETMKLVPVTRGDIQEKALAVGTIDPEKETKVKSTIPGIVAEVLFKVGDAVKAGAPLFKISPNPTPLEYVEARRSMEVAEVGLNKLKADWERQMELFKKALISKSEMDAALQLPGISNAWTMPIKGRLDMLSTGIRTPVGIKVSGADLGVIEKIGLQVEAALHRVPGTRSVYAERVAGGYFLDFVLNRDRLARYGLSVDDANMMVMTAVGGDNQTTTIEGRQRYGVNVRYARDYREDVDALVRAVQAVRAVFA